MTKKVEKLTPAVEKAKKKLKASSRRKTSYSLDTKFGVVTVDDAAEKPPVQQSSVKRKHQG